MSSTRERLIDSALAHMDEHGLEGLTLRSIARSTGVSHAAPVRHFPNLASMLSAVAARSFDGLRGAIDEYLLTAGDDPRSRLAAAGRGYIHFALANPAAYELMFRPERLDCDDPEYLLASLLSFAQLGELVTAAQAAGWRSELDHMQVTGLLWAGVHGIASLWIQGTLPMATHTTDLEPLIDTFMAELAVLPTEGT